MAVLPALQPLFRAILANNGAQEEVPLCQARDASHKAMEQFVTGFYAPHDPLPLEADHCVPVAGGSVTVRVYCPESGGPALPCLLYFHGGGFWLGTLDHFDALCRAIALDTHCIVISVDYRLAPEHKFPTAAEDSNAALLWAYDNADALGIDPTRIAVGGVSAGGNLAAVTALMARDRRGPELVLQVLEVPVTDLSRHDPLHIADEAIELPSGKDVYCRHYLSDPAEALHPHASPLLAQDLSGLPPALIMCAEYDPLAAEGKAYADRLEKAGVPVEHICWPGQFHGAQPMAKLIPQEAAAYHNRIVSALRQAFRKDQG